jgi:cytochrome bd-type quinol oxidase subunit 2
MPRTTFPLMTASHAPGAPYDLVLLAHVLTALVGLGAVVVAGAYALALRRSGPASESVRRYYRPGVNWAGRVLFLVPVLGVALVVMSRGDWSFSDVWVAIGLMVWAVVALAAEMVLWPAERRLQAAVGDPSSAPDLGGQCARAAAVAAVLAILLVVAAVVMVAKP